MQELDRLLHFKAEQGLKAEQEKEIQRKNEKASQGVYGRATEILKRYGERCVAQMGTAAGEGIVGMRSEQVAYLQTPSISIESSSGYGQISLKQRIRSTSGYGFELQSLDIIFQGEYDSSPQVLFSIRRNEVASVGGKVESFVQFEELNHVLSFLETRYEEQGIMPSKGSSEQIALRDFSQNL